MQAIQQLIQERKTIEDYARTTYASLTEMRERIRAEKSAADAEHAEAIDKQKIQEENELLRRQVEALQSQRNRLHDERDQASAQVAGLEQQLQGLEGERDAAQTQAKRLEVERAHLQKQLERIRLECQLAQGDAAQLGRQLDEERKCQTEVEALLHKVEEQIRHHEQTLLAETEKLRAECARLTEALRSSQLREQSLRERLSKTGDLTHEKAEMLRERRELAEKIQLVDQIEAELRQQQAMTQKERNLLARERQPTVPPSAAPTPTAAPAPQAIPLPAIESALLTFSCRNCTKEIQVPVRRAGLMSKCPHCGRIVPIPKG